MGGDFGKLFLVSVEELFENKIGKEAQPIFILRYGLP